MAWAVIQIGCLHCDDHSTFVCTRETEAEAREVSDKLEKKIGGVSHMIRNFQAFDLSQPTKSEFLEAING